MVVQSGWPTGRPTEGKAFLSLRDRQPQDRERRPTRRKQLDDEQTNPAHPQCKHTFSPDRLARAVKYLLFVSGSKSSSIPPIPTTTTTTRELRTRKFIRTRRRSNEKSFVVVVVVVEVVGSSGSSGCCWLLLVDKSSGQLNGHQCARWPSTLSEDNDHVHQLDWLQRWLRLVGVVH